MSEFEVTIEVPGSEYNECIIVEKYGDRYFLVLGQEGKDGNKYKKWAFPQGRDRKPMDKAVPMKIPLGNLVSAHHVADKIRSVLPPLPGAKPNDDIPF